MKQQTINRISYVAAAWVPFVLLFVSSGWATLMLFSPYVAIAVSPLLIPFVIKDHRKVLSKINSRLHIAYFVSWFAVGFFFVNTGDTRESVGSIFTRLFGEAGYNLRDISNQLMLVALVASALLIILISITIRSEKTAEKPSK